MAARAIIGYIYCALCIMGLISCIVSSDSMIYEHNGKTEINNGKICFNIFAITTILYTVTLIVGVVKRDVIIIQNYKQYVTAIFNFGLVALLVTVFIFNEAFNWNLDATLGLMALVGIPLTVIHQLICVIADVLLVYASNASNEMRSDK
ncbi:uncharacterized protein LOC131438820 [Malaya genurostris]|uniref:uncharacterized protein LOC131438820 n=1 Tax=Malaya genurostris TaxID=325434 RepID=UPI0026F3CC9E|nr:uncharacterized protein LOC131438820 [Malaya genurostris]